MESGNSIDRRPLSAINQAVEDLEKGRVTGAIVFNLIKHLVGGLDGVTTTLSAACGLNPPLMLILTRINPYAGEVWAKIARQCGRCRIEAVNAAPELRSMMVS